MKFKGEAGTTGISVGGQFFSADADGVVEVPDDGNYAQALAPFGFVPVTDDPGKAKRAPKQSATTDAQA